MTGSRTATRSILTPSLIGGGGRLKANASHAIVTNARKNKHSMPRLPHLDCPSKS